MSQCNNILNDYSILMRLASNSHCPFIPSMNRFIYVREFQGLLTLSHFRALAYGQSSANKRKLAFFVFNELYPFAEAIP